MATKRKSKDTFSDSFKDALSAFNALPERERLTQKRASFDVVGSIASYLSRGTN